jgi:serine/threonine protein kinase
MAAGRAPIRESSPETPSSDDSLSDSGDSVTDVGEHLLVRSPAIDIARGSLLAGRYQIEDVIGRGGSGIVLRAFDRVAQVAVAVKILKPDLAADPRWIERFSRELRLARQIPHAHVCRVFDIGQADGHWFITMELATGGTLRNHLGEDGRQRTFEQRVEDARAVVAGLAAIHEAGIVHRDLKPDNFLRMADGRLVLSDFGLATNPSDGSMVSILVGTPAYMAPEVVMGEQSSLRSDVWSLGVVLHEIFLGSRPERTSPTGGRRVQRPRGRKVSAAERAMFDLIEACLQDELTDRPADGVEALRLFQQAVAAKGTLLRAGRRPKAAWTWPALVAVGAVAVGIGTGHWWRGASAGSTARDGNARPVVKGQPADWANTTSVVASFEDPIHCLSWLAPDRLLEVVLGHDRRAVVLDVVTKALQPSSLSPQTFALGCPQRSKRGALLFESFDESGRRQIMHAAVAERPDQAKAVTTGVKPAWLPSGLEFAYTADDSHAAIFSIPVMTTTIINERPQDSGLLVGQAIAPKGNAIALRYVDQSMRWHLVVHSLPSLEATYHATFDEIATDFEFVDASGTNLALSLSHQAGTIFARLDTRTNTIARLGAIEGHFLGQHTLGRESIALADVEMRSDIWRLEGGQRTVRLTTDGQSYRPDISRQGDLLVEHMTPDLKSSIQLRQKGHAPRTVTNGSRDYTPHFLPDGRGWLYVDGARGTIRKCDLSAMCQDVYTSTDRDLPFHPVASSDALQIAFVTAIGRERLKLLSSNGQVRDLGPARADCAPRWDRQNHLWVLQGTEQKLSWAEVDAATGELLKTLPVTEDLRNESHDCPPLVEPPEVGPPREVASWSSSLSAIRVVSHQHLPLEVGQNP